MYRNKFTKNAIAAIDFANKSCIKLNSKEMRLEHLFVGILSVKEGVGAKVLSRLGLDPDATLQSIENELRSSSQKQNTKNAENQPGEIAEITVSEEIKAVFQKAFDYAISAGHSYIGTEHLLLGLVSIKDNLFVKELDKLKINFETIKKELDSFVQYPDLSYSEFADRDHQASSQNSADQIKPGKQTRSFLDAFGRNLTQEAILGRLDPVIGRDKEILRVMQVLSRRTKNNPILLGDAGVGKTAIVEGLAQKIANYDVSPVLSNYEIWSIDTASIIAGSQLRGDVESKVLDMIDEIKERGNVILFIDEIHTILGAGSTSNNPLDIGNILKPALARGDLHCIGATTVDEYRRYFDEDPALQRRFQPVDVEELSMEDTFTVLKNLKPVYESFHGVKITDGALRAAIKLTSRYITDRYLPDKAIDVLDEACAKNKLERIKLSDEFKLQLEKLRDTINKRNNALRSKKFEEAANLLDEENKLASNIAKMEKKLNREWSSSHKIITEKEIKVVINQWTKIPLNTLEEKVNDTIKKLESDLSKNIIGQEYATRAVVNAIKRAKAGLSGFDKPLASFLFVGPTGIGKTELAKQLAKSLFGSKEALIQVDMSELLESHSVSKLIGSPPGYVGFDQGGQLTDKVRRRPFSVVLFDEIEKASPEVLNILLQILDEGRLTDSKGRVVNFKNTIIIMTSNIGSEFVDKDSVVGLYIGDKNINSKLSGEFDQAMVEVRERIIDALKEYLQPEFLNRIDDIVVFRKLSKADIAKIAKLHIRNLINRIKKENNVMVHKADSEDIVNYIVESVFSEEYGAREIQRIIKNLLENAIADKILELNWDFDSKKILNLQVNLAKNKLTVTEFVPPQRGSAKSRSQRESQTKIRTKLKVNSKSLIIPS